ncbi:MAG: NmrA family NAD(P)-binding protein [Chitinophagaceae bacterium]
MENQIPRILVLGATGATGKAVVKELESRSEKFEVVLASRKLEQVVLWTKEGMSSVYIDLNDARTIPDALKGISRIYLVTGYTVDMVHQSKTLVDSAQDAGVEFIVHLGIFGNGKMTDPHFTWHEIIERYIETSGIAWCNLHPNTFYGMVPVMYPVGNGTMLSFTGEKKTGYVAVEDIAAVAALVLAQGPAVHAGKNYYLSTENVNVTDVASIVAEIKGKVLPYQANNPEALIAAIRQGHLSLPDDREDKYSESGIEWIKQVYDGRLDSLAVTTTTFENLVGRSGISLKEWIGNNIGLFQL